jgi:hypothetical protein
MKLMKQTGNRWHYLLNAKEADCLRVLLDQFPVAALSSSTITRSDTDPGSVDREKLLNEAMAEHRAELKRQAGRLIGTDKFKPADKGLLFCIKAEERERMLQILNDIRIESWRMLGEPEDLEMESSKLPQANLRYYHFMQLAGYFEHYLLGPH